MAVQFRRLVLFLDGDRHFGLEGGAAARWPWGGVIRIQRPPALELAVAYCACGHCLGVTKFRV